MNAKNMEGGRVVRVKIWEAPIPISLNNVKNVFQLMKYTYLLRYVYLLSVHYILDAVGSSEIMKGKQNLGVTFNIDKQDVIDFTKFLKMTMCKASEANS